MDARGQAAARQKSEALFERHIAALLKSIGATEKSCASSGRKGRANLHQETIIDKNGVSRDIIEIRKAHKYIRRWEGADGKFHYAYPQGWKGKRNRDTAKRAIAAKTELITKIRPLEVRSEQDITNAINAMIRRGGKKGFACHALGDRPVFVTRKTEKHIKASKGETRTIASRNRKARYIPFIPALLENGRISEKSRKREGLVYGIIGQVKYTRGDGQEVHECVELAIAYDEKKGNSFFLLATFLLRRIRRRARKT